MKRILIIGSEGFIGSNISRVFSEKYNVYCADILEITKFNYFKLDALSPDFKSLLKKIQPDSIINCSGAANVPLSFDSPLKDFNLNTLRIIEMLDAVRLEAPLAKYIHLSSAAVYGNPPELPIKETSPIQPVSPYGCHKYYAEQICKEYSTHFNIKTISLRIFSCYGPGLKKQIFWDVNEKRLNNDIIELYGSGAESRDFIYIDDVANIIDILIKKSKFYGQTVNAASGKMVTINEAVKVFLDKFNCNSKFVFTGITRKGDPDNWQADISYLTKLGFKPEYTLEKGLEKTALWLKEL